MGVLIFFTVSVIVGLLVLALSKGGDSVSSKDRVNLSVWGSASESAFQALISASGYSGDSVDSKLNVSYKYIPEKDFNGALLEALAGGYGPDIILMTDTNMALHAKRTNILSHQYYSERLYKDSFIEGAEMFLSPEGVVAFPFSVDPLVMYWNRDMFNNAGVATPPKYWDEFSSSSLVDRLSVKSSQSIEKSAFSLGGFSNIENAKEIISAMMMQAGAPIVRNSVVALQNAESPVYFYTEFANPSRTTYTWNRSLPNSKQMFISDRLAVYFGFASEAGDIKAKNPNLNFDMASFPQLRDGKNRTTFGRFSALAVLKQSKNTPSAFEAVFKMTGAQPVLAWTQATGLPPVRRDLLSSRPSDALGAVLFDSAFWARAFADPDHNQTKNLFGEMIDSIVSGRSTVGNAVGQFSSRLYNIISSQQ